MVTHVLYVYLCVSPFGAVFFILFFDPIMVNKDEHINLMMCRCYYIVCVPRAGSGL